MDQEFEMTSLCQVEANFLHRLADLKGGRFVPFVKDTGKRAVFDNRDYLYYKESPIEVNEVGVFDWKATENISTDGNDYITSTCTKIVPIEVIRISSNTSFDNILSKLRTGLDRRYLGCDYFIVKSDVMWKNEGRGIYIPRSAIEVNGRQIKLSEDVLQLNMYAVMMADIIKTDNGALFYAFPEPGNILQKIPSKSIDEYIKYYFTNSATWTNFKTLGATRTDWKIFKQYLDAYSTETLLDELTKIYTVKRVEAKQHVDKFVNEATKNIDTLPVEPDDLRTIILSIPSLKDSVFEIGKEGWQKENLQKLKGLQKTIEEIQKKINDAEQNADIKIARAYAEKEKEARKKFDVIQKELDERQRRLDEKQKKLTALDDEIAEKTRKLNQLDENFLKSQDTAEEIKKKISEKIGSAREDITDFIAEAQIYLELNRQNGNEVKGLEKPIAFIKGKMLSTEELEEENSISDLIDVLLDELETAGVSSDYSRLMAVYLSGNLFNKENILLLGPNGMDIANALSVSINGKYADVLDCSQEFNREIIEKVRINAGEVVAVKYPFTSGWIDKIPEIVNDQERVYFLLHPYYEDVLIEPESLYNYVKPLITWPFVDHSKVQEFLGGNLKISREVKDDGNVIPEVGNILKASGMKGYTYSRILSVQKLLNANSISDTEMKDSMMLFAALPYAMVTGHEDQFYEAVKDTSAYRSYRRLMEEVLNKKDE